MAKKKEHEPNRHDAAAEVLPDATGKEAGPGRCRR